MRKSVEVVYVCGECMMYNTNDFKKSNLGGYFDTDFKESDSVTIATTIIEQGRQCKTHLQKEDRTANIDGRVSILLNSFEFQVVEAQIKTLPEKTDTSVPFKFSCDTKIINFARFKVSSNPVVLFVVDRKRGKLFFKLFSSDYIEKLKVGEQKYKTLCFDSYDEYSDRMFISKVFHFLKITSTDIDCCVDCRRIRQIVKNAKKVNYRQQNGVLFAGDGTDNENKVYTRGNVVGTLVAYRVKQDGKRKYVRNGVINMRFFSDTDSADIDEYATAVIHFKKGYVRITRITPDSINITDADFGNIILEIAKEVDKENLPVLYYNRGPLYWFEGTLMYQMKSERIELPRELRG